MWWKLGILSIVTAAVIFCVIPIRTHAVLIDPEHPPPAFKLTLLFIVSNMYFTPATLALIGVLLSMATYIGFRIVRNS